MSLSNKKKKLLGGGYFEISYTYRTMCHGLLSEKVESLPKQQWLLWKVTAIWAETGKEER